MYSQWCGHCKALAPEWITAAKKLAGSVRVGAVDCDVEKELCGKYEVKGFPTIKSFAVDKQAKPVDYTGAREAAAIVTHGQSLLGAAGAGGGGLVASVPYLEAHRFLFGGPAGTPSVLYLADAAGAKAAKAAPPWLSSLAVKFKDGKTKRVSLGYATDPAVASRFGVDKLPALVAVVPPRPGADASATHYVVRLPSLPLSAAAALKDVKTWLDTVLADEVPAADRLPPPAFPAARVPRKQADVSFAPLTEDNLATACFVPASSSKKGGARACVIALVGAGGADSPPVVVAEALAKKYRNDPLSFVWLDATEQPAFAAALGAPPGHALPTLRVVKPGSRPRVASFDGEFGLSPLSEFVDKVLGGDAHFAPLPALPELVNAEVESAVRDALRDEL